jgi:hypothetical protein
MADVVVKEQGGPPAPRTLLGRAPARIPTGGKIRPGHHGADPQGGRTSPKAKTIYCAAASPRGARSRRSSGP